MCVCVCVCVLIIIMYSDQLKLNMCYVVILWLHVLYLFSLAADWRTSLTSCVEQSGENAT